MIIKYYFNSAEGKKEYIGDFNDFINHKKYIINTVHCLNQPTDGNGSPINSYGTLLVEKDAYSIHQIFFSDSIDDVYIRRYNSTWNNWRQQEAIVAKSFGTNGYIKYASELIVQWGEESLPTANVEKIVAFPIKFSQYVITFIEVNGDFSSSTPMPVNIISNGINAFIIKSITPVSLVNWIAIGY